MSSRVSYLDASALVKLVLSEAESEALGAWVDGASVVVTSEVALVEVVRAARLADGQPEAERLARRRLEETSLVPLDRDVMERAATLAPPRLRALDAIHLATALEVEPDEFVAYDERLLRAAEAAGLAVASPGRSI